MTSLADARGDVVVMTFIYTTCWDLCPAEAATMMRAVNQVGDGITAYAISVDPVGDTPKRVDAWLARAQLAERPAALPHRHAPGARARVARVRHRARQRLTPEEAYEAAEATDEFRAQAPTKGSTSRHARTAVRSARSRRPRRSRRTPT